MLRKNEEQIKILKSYYDIPDISLYEQLRLLVSDSYNEWNASSRRRNWDQILPRLYLGRLPRHGDWDLPEDVKLVVSVNSYQEVSGKGMLSEVLSPADLESQGRTHLFVHMPDFTADVAPGDIIDATKSIRKQLEEEDGAVYIHCKAGRSRSAMLCAIYLATYGGYEGEELEANLEDAINFIKRCRPQIDVDRDKVVKAREILGIFATHDYSSSRSRSLPNFEVTDNEYEYLASFEGKNAVRQLTAFKELAAYATRIQKFVFGCQRTNHIRDFFNQILYSQDGRWYDDLKDRRGHIDLLLNANKGTSEKGVADKAERERLVTNLTAAIQDLVNEKRHTLVTPRAVEQEQSAPRI